MESKQAKQELKPSESKQSGGPGRETKNCKLRDYSNPANVIAKLFDRFARLYGSKFVTPDRDGWVAELADFRLEAIAYALKEVEKKYTEWPPALIEFKALCRNYVLPLAERVHTGRKAIEQHTGKGRLTTAAKEALRWMEENVR